MGWLAARSRHRLLFDTARPVFKVTLIAGLMALLNACVQQDTVRDEGPIRSAESAAGQTILIAPGPPPADLAAPSDVIILERLRKRAEQRRLAAAKLRLDSGEPPQQDIWARLRAGYDLPVIMNNKVRRELQWYQNRPDYVQRVTDRARLYLAYIVHEAQRRKLPTELALLPVVESAYQPYARSPAGAMGIWQFIRTTGRRYGLKQSHWYDARRDIVESTRAAFDYLEKLHKEFNGDWLLAIAAYNSGEGNVGRAVARNRARGRKTDFWSLRLPAETRAYVPRLLAVAALFKNPQRYGLQLDAIEDDPYFQSVATLGQINLPKAAEMAGIGLNELLLLNPGFMRHVTDPSGPHRLQVPVESATRFSLALANLDREKRLNWSSHQVTKGESLRSIARNYGVTVQSIRTDNHLKGSLLKVGQQLRISGTRSGAKAFAGLSKEVRNGILRARRSTERRVHRVRRGESIWIISRRYKVSMNKLLRWNQLTKKSLLHPGQRIVIWGPGRVTAAGVKSAPRLAKSEQRPHFHTIRRGDNLWTLARHYRIQARDLARWNQLQDNAILQIGRKLRLYPEQSASRMAPLQA